MIAGIQNRTSQYVDTKNLTDRIRTLLFKSNAVRFINEARAYAADILPKARGDANAIRERSQAYKARVVAAARVVAGSSAAQ